jgi:hypothetical protein
VTFALGTADEGRIGDNTLTQLDRLPHEAAQGARGRRDAA